MFSRSSSQKEKASLLPALLFVFQYLRHLTNAAVAHIFPLVHLTVHIEMRLNDIIPTNPLAEEENEAGFGLNCCWESRYTHTYSPGCNFPLLTC